MQVSLCEAATASSTPSERCCQTADSLSVCVDPTSAPAIPPRTVTSSAPPGTAHLLTTTGSPLASRREVSLTDCVMVHVSQLRGLWCPCWRFMYTAGEWAAAAWESGTVDRDWSNNVVVKYCWLWLPYISQWVIRLMFLCSTCYAAPSTVQSPPLTNGDHEHTLPHPPYVHKSQHYRHERRTGIVTHYQSDTELERPPRASSVG